MSDDTQAAREALPCPFCSSTRLAVHPDHAVECFDCEAIGPGMSPEPWASRSIPAAAALLRAAGYVVEQPIVIAEEKVSDETLANLLRVKGWTVEEPKCETCGGIGENETNSAECPTCNGTGARP